MFVIFIILLFIAALIYSFGNFYFIKKFDNLPLIISISIGFAVLEYLIKIFSYYNLKKNLNIFTLQSLWIILTYICVLIIKKFALNDKIPIYSLIIAIAIISLIILNFYIDFKL
tara:strand:+ start:658 stop:999 length:342 start_codon:yes stop_codon:yes gene_type:complete